MINCPKCGFNQPKDQYCANCGIDMVSFKPEKPGVLKSISNSSAFYLFIVALVIFTSWHLWQHKKTQLISERLRLTKNNYVNLSLQDTNNTSTQEDTLEASSQQEADNMAEAELMNTSESEASVPSPATVTEAGADPELVSAQNPDDSSYKIQISFYEATTNFINDLMMQSQRQGKFFNLTDYSFGALWGSNFKIANALKNRDIKLLDNYEILQYKPKTPFSKFIGYVSEDPDQNLGIEVAFNVSEQSENLTNVEFDILRSLKPNNDKNAPPVKRSFPGQLELKSNESFFIAGILPYKSPSEVETELLSNKLFQIYQSSAYQNKSHDMILLIQITKN